MRLRLQSLHSSILDGGQSALRSSRSAPGKRQRYALETRFDAFQTCLLQRRNNATATAENRTPIGSQSFYWTYIQMTKYSNLFIRRFNFKPKITTNSKLGCTAVFLIECPPTFQRYVLP
jgi:hypothetical protein